ncbi:hypothetical protein V8B97DRAFT_1919485 [Scleroderma yunnanense]
MTVVSETKVVILLLGMMVADGAMTSPYVPEALERNTSSRLAAIGQRLLFGGIRMIFWSWTITEAAAALSASELCPHLIRQLIAKLLISVFSLSRANSQTGTLSPSFSAGACLVIVGSLIRRHCYRILGHFFTFELSIRKDHKLITSGPYSIVRHPSYLGAICMLVGSVLCAFDRKSWIVASSGLFPHDEVSSTRTLWFLRALALSLSSLALGRMNNEDAMLERTFGKEWRAWVEKVPYKLIPGVY